MKTIITWISTKDPPYPSDDVYLAISRGSIRPLQYIPTTGKPMWRYPGSMYEEFPTHWAPWPEPPVEQRSDSDLLMP